MYKAEVRGPLILGNKDYRQITSDIIAPIDNPTPGWWKVALAISLTMASFGIFAIYYTVRYGLGTWAVNNSVAWGWEIINFVWWIGIGHAEQPSRSSCLYSGRNGVPPLTVQLKR